MNFRLSRTTIRQMLFQYDYVPASEELRAAGSGQLQVREKTESDYRLIGDLSFFAFSEEFRRAAANRLLSSYEKKNDVFWS